LIWTPEIRQHRQNKPNKLTSQYKPRATSDLARTAANDSEQFRTVTNTIATSNEYIFNPKIPRMKRKLSRIFINIWYIYWEKNILIKYNYLLYK
jgi:hypothetical protein